MLLAIKPMTIIFIGAIVAIVGGVISAIGTLKHNRASSEKSTNTLNTVRKTGHDVEEVVRQNQALTEKAEALQTKVDSQYVTIDELRRENTELHDKLANQANDIYNNLTGGDSYCRMQFSFNNANDMADFVFMLQGKYPLKNVTARIVDLNVWGKTPVTIESITKDVINVGDLDPAKPLYVQKRFKLDKVNGVSMNIFFAANNGFTVQKVRMKFINGRWLFAEQISEKKDGGKVLFEKIDSDYPDKKTIFREL